MTLYSEPPPLYPFQHDKPTLLVCWWITTFCTVIILLRVGGRFVRSERLFTEDKVAGLTLIPLYLRMGCVHFILTHGTNNAQLAGLPLSRAQIRNKEIASGLVLLSRALYAATLWILKDTIVEFFRRLNVSWDRSYERTLKFIRLALLATFIAVIISDLAECHPFRHYWQVQPDPGGQCRQGYAQLLTLAVCNVLTDLLLVIFPIPIIIRSGLNVKRKIQLVLLFSLSLAVVAVTVYRVPHIIEDHGSQRSRSLYASVELLFATAAANALVLGSFVRDRGVKKMRFKYGSMPGGSVDRSSVSEARRPTLNKHWGSLEDLARDTGYGVQPELRASESASGRRYGTPRTANGVTDDLNDWRFPSQKRLSAARSDDALLPRDDLQLSRTDSSATPRKVSFFDVGGLLDDQGPSRRASLVSGTDVTSPRTIPSPSVPASTTGLRRGSTAFLQDIGGILSPHSPRSPHSLPNRSKNAVEMQPLQRPSRGSNYLYPISTTTDDHNNLVLRDPGGLLDSK
ncbi:hypothetical protein VTK73DRAFT_759 [Phialemonium thermophilum]|uniref:Rhodopsin domain-containing protein n=1 Tax=Phialemonium thermophilum TaxID=223376 RepID=A0ABR3XCZ8_9PEZI